MIPVSTNFSFNLNLESMVESGSILVGPSDRRTILERTVFLRETLFQEEVFSSFQSIYT